MRIILASKSPRRKELLSLIYDDFEIIVSDVDETTEEIDKEKVPLILSERKADKIHETEKDALIIAADTIVLLDNRIFGKPEDRDAAFSMIKSLSGRTHKVITGCTLICKGKKSTFSETTEVTFKYLTDKEIMDYVETDEPYDKAGAYGIQGKAGLFVESINGDYNNVVGLPVERLKKEIDKILAE